MRSLFPLIAQRDMLYGECAAEVLYSTLQTKEEYVAFRTQIVDIFNSDVSKPIIIGLFRCEPTLS